MDYLSNGQSIRQSIIALVNQIFIIITSLSKLSPPNPQHHMFENTLTMLKIIFIFIWDPKNLENLSNHKKNVWKLCFTGLPQVKGNTKSSSFTYMWWNENNWFFNNPCKVTSFKITTQKWNCYCHELVLRFRIEMQWPITASKSCYHILSPLCGLQTNLEKTNTNISIIASLHIVMFCW